jgi:hypothetical protein
MSYCSVRRFKYQFYLNVHYFRAVQGLIRLDCYMWATRIRQINRAWIAKRPKHFKGSWKRENTALWVFPSSWKWSRVTSQRTTKYVKRNIEVILFNHCCSKKAVSIAYSECVFLASGIQSAIRTRYIFIRIMSDCTRLMAVNQNVQHVPVAVYIQWMPPDNGQ